MPASSPRAAFFRAFRGAIPFGMVVGPFGVLFGVLATEAGLSVFEVLSFSVIVIAGAAQMTALQLMQDNAPTVIVLAAALTVNLRMAMYSASLTPHLGALPVWKRAIVAYFTVDQSFAMSQQEFETKPQMTLEEKVAFFFGSVAPVCPIWYVGTWAGAALGTQIPESFALDFAVPITFIALVTPALRTIAHVAAAVTSVILALLLAFIPYSLGLFVAGAVAMMVGAEVERRMEAKR